MSSAIASVNGLNEEPGLPVTLGREVERVMRVVLLAVDVDRPPTIARTSPVLLSIATIDALGRPEPAGSSALIACSAACCMLEVERGADLQPAVVGAVLGDVRRQVPWPIAARICGRSQLVK